MMHVPQMLKMGIPLGAVEQALQKEGKDKSIASMDPEKSYSSQITDKPPNKADVPLKDDPAYAKFFKVREIVFIYYFRGKIESASLNSQYIRSSRP